MLYKLAHVIATKFRFLWKIIEWVNGGLFYIIHCVQLKNVPMLINKYSGEYQYRKANSNDAASLADFFANQPQEAFKYFNPHRFEEKSLRRYLKNKAFLAFVVEKDNKIVGYFFLRCFFNGKCFRGKIVHQDWQGKGIAKEMGLIMTEVSQSLGLRMFGTISPDNFASLASSKASNEVKIIRTLENGFFYIEYLPKRKNDN